MYSQQSLNIDHTRPLYTLDIESVSDTKPDAAITIDRSIISWHNLATVIRLLFKTVATPFKPLIYSIDLVGDERNSGENLKLTYIGDKSNYEYVMSCLYEAEPEVVSQRWIPFWSINKRIKKERINVDLIVVDIDFPLNFLIQKQGTLMLPRWLKQKVPIRDTWQDVLAAMRRKTRREALRSIRKHNLSARVVRDTYSDRYFYHQLYKPYIFKRYGSQAAVVDEERFLKECSIGQLIQVLQGEKVLGVVLVHLTGKQLTIAWTGIDNDVDDAKLNGVADALDLYSLLYAYNQGCDVMDMGGSRPLINDGVLRYKKKWGGVISQGVIPKGNIYYIPGRMSPSIESFLQNNPMILSKGKKLSCVSWNFSKKKSQDTVDDDEIDQCIHKLTMMYIQGLDEFQYFQVLNKEAGIRNLTGTIYGIPYHIKQIPRIQLIEAMSNIKP